jgi:zinc transport system substrate-binding protein
MMFSMRLWWVTYFALSMALFAWTESHAQPTVYVVNYPLQYFTERIGAEQVQVVFPAPADEDPAFWKPDANAIAAFQAADLILINGATYAKWLKTASLPKSKMVNTSERFKTQYIEIKDMVTHSHGPSGAHSHAGTAFTTWLDFRLAAQQAQAIKEALSRLLPEQKSAFEQRYAELEQDLLALDKRLDTIVAEQRTQPLVASHPVYQYLAKRYGLNLQSVLWEPEVMPEDEQWQGLQSILKTHAAKWMLWEGDPLPASVDRLQTLGVKSLVFDPCGNVPEQGDFLSVMKQNVENLQQAFQ